MALAKASLIGDIDLGGINNQGVSSGDIAAIFAAQAQTQAIQEARERTARKQRQKLIIISSSMVISLIAIVALYFFTRPKS